MNTGYLQLLKGRGCVLEPFLNRVYLKENVRSLILVSPWITHLRFHTGSTNQLLARINEYKAKLMIITRCPEDGADEHSKFIADASKLKNCDIYFIEDLHAKYYLCDAVDLSFAMLGSPNMYKWTKNTFEIGVMIESRGEGDSIIDDLEALTIDLRISKTSKCFKKGGK